MPGLDKSHHHSLEFRVQVSQFHAIFQKPFILSEVYGFLEYQRILIGKEYLSPA